MSKANNKLRALLLRAAETHYLNIEKGKFLKGRIHCEIFLSRHFMKYEFNVNFTVYLYIKFQLNFFFYAFMKHFSERNF